MTEDNSATDLKQVVGALVFAAKRALSLDEIRKNLVDVAAAHGGRTAAFANVTKTEINDALEALRAELAQRRLGFLLAEVAGGFRLQTDDAGGPWVRRLLDLDKPQRLSRPALETLSIIAYRQPITRVEIEGVRGVNVDHVIRGLMELQLIRIAGRSDLPGRPMLYGTTKLFLDHFGLADLKELPGIEQLARAKMRAEHRKSAAGEEGSGQAQSDQAEDANDGETVAAAVVEPATAPESVAPADAASHTAEETEAPPEAT